MGLRQLSWKIWEFCLKCTLHNRYTPPADHLHGNNIDSSLLTSQNFNLFSNYIVSCHPSPNLEAYIGSVDHHLFPWVALSTI